MNNYMEWIVRAYKDIISMRQLLASSPIIYENVCNLAQQSVEKLLKAYLVSKEIEPPRTHFIHHIILLCTNIDKDFEKYYEKASYLTQYAVGVRYPEENIHINIDDALQASKTAEEVLDFIKRKLDINEIIF